MLRVFPNPHPLEGRRSHTGNAQRRVQRGLKRAVDVRRDGIILGARHRRAR